MRKGKLAFEVLKVLGKVALSTAEVIEAVLSSPYGASYARLERRAREIRRDRSIAKQTSMSRREFYDLMSRLHKDGLVAKQGTSTKNRWRITPKGRREVGALKTYFSVALPETVYKKEHDTQIKIIAFDIPEKYKRKRRWLRSALKNLGFTMRQKSVWVGTCKLPHIFMEDLNTAGLIPYVEILAVTKAGSLKEIT